MNIGELKQKSDLSYNVAIAKRNALEKAQSRQVIVYKEHIFRADPETINLVSTLKNTNDKFFVLDTNNNPVEITDPTEFLKILIDRNQESLSSYHQMSKTFESRSD
tara:strand:+ start:104 stop:421 length:318 start_codon:yes stop_codon:yes gene_type:complete